MPRPCTICAKARSAVRRPRNGQAVCRECFLLQFEHEVHETIIHEQLFCRGDVIAIGASGGKDSTVLAYVLSLLNKRHAYGLDLRLLSVDEGIAGYRDDSLDTVRRNEQQYGIPLTVVSYKDLYGWTMDEIVSAIGTRGNCTFCGVFRRQALDRGALLIGADKVATGHNADDIAETVVLNLLRGDFPRLARCADAVTGRGAPLPRVKPFKYTYEKEIVMYAYFQKLDYFATECVYAPHAYRGRARELIKDAEALRSSVILDVIRAAETLTFPSHEKETDSVTSGCEKETSCATECGRKTSDSGACNKSMKPTDDCAVSAQEQRQCLRCGFITSQKLCKACVLTDSLNNGTAAIVNRR